MKKGGTWEMSCFAGREADSKTLKEMIKEAPGQLNFTAFLTLFGEKMHGKRLTWIWGQLLCLHPFVLQTMCTPNHVCSKPCVLQTMCAPASTCSVPFSIMRTPCVCFLSPTIFPQPAFLHVSHIAWIFSDACFNVKQIYEGTMLAADIPCPV